MRDWENFRATPKPVHLRKIGAHISIQLIHWPKFSVKITPQVRKPVREIRYYSPTSDCRLTQRFRAQNKSQSRVNTYKIAVLLQVNRAMPQLFFSVYSSPTTFTTSLRVAKLRKPGFRARNIPAQNRICFEFRKMAIQGHSRSRVLESVKRW